MTSAETCAGTVGGAAAPRQPGLRATIAGLNHNVLLTAVARALNGVASGIWAMSTIATYLFMIEDNSNTVSAPFLGERRAAAPAPQQRSPS